jgi:hypothetical protein
VSWNFSKFPDGDATFVLPECDRRPKTQFKNSLSGGDRAPLLNGLCGMLTKPALVHGESDLSDHTKDLQKNLMRQVHEDVVNKPKMLVAKKNNSSESSCATSRLSYGISELIKVHSDIGQPRVLTKNNISRARTFDSEFVGKDVTLGRDLHRIIINTRISPSTTISNCFSCRYRCLAPNKTKHVRIAISDPVCVTYATIGVQ